MLQEFLSENANTIGFALATGGPLLGIYAILRWRKSQDAQSIFKDAEDFEDVGMRVLGAMGNASSARRLDDTKEYSMTWGSILLIPVFVAAVLYLCPWDQLWASFGIESPLIIYGIYAAFGAILLHIWVWLAFFHRLKYDSSSISVVSETLQTQRAALRDLVAVELSPGRPLFVLKFRDGTEMKVSRFMSHYNRIVEDLNAHVARNLGLAHQRGI